jgi:MoaA/NifB/PqqE/SkfB family radical SAM enzyme
MSRKREMLGALKRAWLSKVKTPLVLTVHVTDRCTRDCPFCKPPGGPDPSFESIMTVIKEARQNGTVRINLTGGEPLLRDDIGQIISESSALGLEVDLRTNGDLVETKIDDLMELRAVQIGLDGPQKFHDSFRGEGSFSYAVGAARLLIMRGIATSFEALILKDSIYEIESLMDIADRIGVPIHFRPAGRDTLMSPGENPHAEAFPPFRKSIEALVNQKTEGRSVGNSLKGLALLKEWHDNQNLGRCLWGYLHCRMETDGSLYMCHEPCRPLPPNANAFEEGFINAFSRLAPSACVKCWGSARSDMYIAAKGRMGILWDLLQGQRIG